MFVACCAYNTEQVMLFYFLLNMLKSKLRKTKIPTYLNLEYDMISININCISSILKLILEWFIEGYKNIHASVKTKFYAWAIKLVV